MAQEARETTLLRRLSTRVTRRAALRGSLALAAIPLLAACSQGTQSSPTAAPTTAAAAQPTAAPTTASQPTAAATTAPTAAATTAPTAAATTAATAAPTTAATAAASPSPAAQTSPISKIGGAVSVLATWGGDEQASFLAMVKPWEDQSGAKVNYEGTRDLSAVLATRVKAGNPPDLAGLPGPGQMAQFAKDGKLVDLSGVLDMTAMSQQYADSWLKLAQADGKQVGIFIKAALKGTMWYNPKVFQQASYTVPKTWDDLMKLSDQIASTGKTPWSVGLESGTASGWPAADLIDDIVLRQAGPTVYDNWYQGKQKWTSPEIKKAWQTWGQIVGNPKMIYGGKQYVLSTNFGKAADPLFTNPPGAFLHYQATFITSFIEKDNSSVKPVTDYNFFFFPTIDPQYSGAAEGSGDLFGMFKKTDQSASLIQWLTTPDAQSIWVKRGGALSPNKKVALDTYPDEISKNAAQVLANATLVRFGADDLMPTAMENAFWKGTLDYVGDPTKLDSILSHLDSVQGTAYGS